MRRIIPLLFLFACNETYTPPEPTYSVILEGYSSTEETEIKEAFKFWQAISPKISFGESGYNSIVIRNKVEPNYRAYCHRLSDRDFVINLPSGYSMTYTATHELGHALLLNHVQDDHDIMYHTSADGMYYNVGEQDKATLHSQWNL
jgi:Matrixin